MNKPKLVRITTVPLSLDKLLEGQLKFMNEFFDVTAISADDNGYLEKVAKREGVKHKAIELTRAITPFADIKALWKLYKFLKKEKPQIVHTHTPKAGTVGMWAAKLAGIPIRLHTVAGLPLLETTGNKRILLDNVEKQTYAAAQLVLPNSLGLKEIIVKSEFTKPEKLKMLANGSTNGIDTEKFNPKNIDKKSIEELKKELNIQENDFVFIFVGRLVKDKGINELANSFNLLIENYKGNKTPKLLLVGPLESDLDPLENKTIQLIENHPNIIAVGYQNNVIPYFAISHVLTFPSYREGFPNVVMQAGAMGLPSIVTNINGCNEIIIDGQNGTIIPTKNAKELHKAMMYLIENVEYTNKLASNSRELIESRFSQIVVWNAILEEYKTQLNKLSLNP